MEYLLLLVGFVLLVKGADFFVEGSSSLAKIMKVPSVIIGLTIVAMGTSAPEASVSINAALTGNNDIAISNVVGSNIFNGLVAVIFGGDLVVDNACVIAANFGVSQNFIGLTIIAIGTSLPELVTSIVATRKGDSGLALGNAIGSNIFNILFILGMSATISPLNVLGESLTDCIILLISAVILFVLAKTKKTMSRWEGAVCVLLYIVYTAYLLIR